MGGMTPAWTILILHGRRATPLYQPVMQPIRPARPRGHGFSELTLRMTATQGS